MANRGQFKPGQSGNPKGKPKGARHRATVVAQSLLDGEAEELTRKCIELALGGDMTALRLCLERLVPPRRDAPVSFTTPVMETAGDAVSVLGAIVQAVADGEITPAEGATVASLIETFRRTLETEELERRITELERSR